MFSYVHKKSALPDFSDSAFCMKGNLLVALYVFSSKPCDYLYCWQNYPFS
ncbi:hypothetical protein HMPREF9151_01039 [Hoylesella saccharolytica F0055]|uniref:Uncharacterized protein n=1 Tax=Hoylesella saccharolytica F0055 TaxID=1127699 RepID=L1NE10_9BACT|nr:hypothetical protein HMPREF9151_01039 [Hoylesella saccharolytica F0055]